MEIDFEDGYSSQANGLKSIPTFGFIQYSSLQQVVKKIYTSLTPPPLLFHYLTQPSSPSPQFIHKTNMYEYEKIATRRTATGRYR